MGYGGLKFFDIDEDNQILTVTKMYFHKARGQNAYNVFATMDGYDENLPDDDPKNDPFWQPWIINDDFFDCVRLYYSTRMDVKCYEAGGDCLSDNE
jgi:hypothetical protein